MLARLALATSFLCFCADCAGTDHDPATSTCAEVRSSGPRLFVHRQRPGGVEALTSGASAGPGDVVQLTYEAAGQRYGAIVSFDGEGEVTLHHPLDPGAPPILLPARTVLDHAFALDDAAHFERFILVTSDDPTFDVARVLAAARRLSSRAPTTRTEPLPLPEDWLQASFLLEKRP